MTTDYNSDNAAQQVRDAAQIIDVVGECVKLIRAGVNLKGLCPFHAEKTPSFMVNPARQTFHCFGCGEGGDVFTFMMKYHRMTFPEALKELARRYRIPLPEKKLSPADRALADKRQRLFAANDRAAALYHDLLRESPRAGEARAYLAGRDIGEPWIESFRLGYAPKGWDFLSSALGKLGIEADDAVEAGLIVRKEKGGFYDRFRDRVLFPIVDLTGRTAGFSGRILGEGEPKYLNTPESPVFDKSRLLLGLHQHRDRIRTGHRALLVEGNFDLLALAVHGVDYAVAPLGTALTSFHIRTLKGYADEVILLFDGDAAGVKAAMRAVPLFLAEGIESRVAVLPPEHDPDTYVRTHGREGLEALVAEARPLPEFMFDNLVRQYGTSLDGKARILRELQPVILAAGDTSMQRSVLVSYFSEQLGLDAAEVLKGFQAAERRAAPGPAPRRGSENRPQEAAGPRLSRQQRQLLEFVILNPQFLPQCLEAGIEEVLTQPAAATILVHIQTLNQSKPDGTVSPEELLNLLPEGAERTFVSQLLINVPPYPLEERERMMAAEAAEMVAWLREFRLLKDKARLEAEIRRAAAAGDHETLMALSQKKIEVNMALEQREGKATGGEEAA
jgi:DNA primase